MALPLPANRKLVGILEIISTQDDKIFDENDLKVARDISPILGQYIHSLDRRKDSTPEEQLHRISQVIHSAKHVDDILIEVKNSILDLFEADVITIYAVDSANNEIYSKVKSGDRIDKIRVPISPVSIAGWVAMSQKSVNIKNVYDAEEIKTYHEDIVFDDSWDKKTGYQTNSMLSCPMLKGTELMGVLQLINKKDGGPFTEADEKNAKIISETLALAFHNYSKYVPETPTKFSYLVNEGIISAEELKEAILKSRKSQIDVENILLNDFKIKRSDLGKSLETFHNLPYFTYSDTVVLPGEVFTGLNKNFLLKNFWTPLQKEGDKITILINSPDKQDTINNIKLIFSRKQIEFKVGLKIDIYDYLNSSLGYDESISTPETEGMSSLLSALKDESGAELESAPDNDESNMISETDSTIVRLVNKILIDAYDRGVSDIHIEPGLNKDPITVRFRKDGECSIYEEIPYLFKHAVLSRIKIMSKLDIAERRMPQDGKIRMKYGPKDIEYRVATCPTVGGNEDAVLRILAASKPIPLDKMNFNDRNYAKLIDKIVKPYGLILVVGPTGSGKTTTLHSALGYINKPGKKIWTAEDPVEITQRGLRQVQMLNKIGLDFARAMKSFLRGDPDVIMVGEMRDAETCSIGLEASLTGHLVFSTLHTNSAPETITRLLDMGMNPLNFADALLLIVAQRLVRTLCKNCKEDYHPSREEFDTLVREYGEKDFQKLGIEYTDDLMLKGPKGCEKCGDSGYAGRTGIHELLEGTNDMKRMVMQQSMVEQLREQAIKDGMTTLKQDGILKIFKGDCDLKQVLAVCIV
ncbi:MAG: GspE/PulE family protein [Candidatus Nitrohelix vancouverensis]|uniref:GspE/PulE family protein n=1 Tax=Candidatus Nitrohelix vancouverensis TaxID=2705534 RepID=A0A7T0C5V9_9BACT|nr:MAG: GspE/PulE family protein [Candidatus Nitrohelix vancouverensis]